MTNPQISPHAAAPEEARNTPATRPAPRPVIWTLPGFCGTMRVTTSFGDLPLQALRVRDPLRTSDGNFAKVAWVDQVRLDEDFLSANPDALPILLPAGCLGRNQPRVDLVTSPHQRLLVASSDGQSAPRLARDLLGRPGVVRKPAMSVTYTVFHCGALATIYIEGLPVTIAP
ncbi:MAG: Hint domain-containing protein [Paracoccaceae bacterium]